MVTVLAVAGILCATMVPASGEEPVGSHLCLVCGTTGGVDVVLNILLFVPLGAGLALLGVPAGRAILLIFSLSTLIEFAQFAVIPGRDATLGDVVSNTLGGALSFVGTRGGGLWLRPRPRNAWFFLGVWGAIWLCIQSVSSAAFTLSIPDSEYYGQLAPVLGHYSIFSGQVIAAHLGDLAIPDTIIADGRGLRRRLIDGATSTVSVTPGETGAGVAPILRVVDIRGHEIVLVGQQDVDLLFGVRTLAANMRLRPPQFALSRVFRQGRSKMPGDTLVLTGRYVPSQVTMGSLSSGVSGSDRIVIPITASLGWTLVLPWQWYIEGTSVERFLSWLWVSALVLPFGYWGALSRPLPDRRSLLPGVVSVAVVIAIVYAGLHIVPRLFGLSTTRTGEWLSALAGAMIGAAIAMTRRERSEVRVMESERVSA